MNQHTENGEVPVPTTRPALLGGLLFAVLALGGCGGAEKPSDQVAAPKVGQCREVTTDQLADSTNDSAVVPCSQAHTAETFYVGKLNAEDAAKGRSSERVGAAVFKACDRRFARFVGADQSLALRTPLTWAWFGPSAKGWEAGARWYRCDVVSGGASEQALDNLPESTKGVLLGRPSDQFLLCVAGASLPSGAKVRCSEPHQWRAISTVQLGREGDPYPGDQLVAVKSREFCSDQVGAYLGYPVVDYDYSFTHFHRADWKAGNRRAICWAKTDQ